MPDQRGADGPDGEVARLQRRLAREHRIRLDAEQIARTAVARLDEADRLKTVFLATVSHELRTPLTSIAGFTSLLLNHGHAIDADQRLDMLERIDRNSKVLLTLIEGLLEFTEIEQGSTRLAPAPLVLAPAVAATIAGLEATLVEHAVRVEVDDATAAFVDERAFRRILTNLLVNAARYAPAGTSVTVSAATGGDRTTVLVDDQGPGVAEGERAMVFERFFRGTSPVVAATHGSGIGLTVVRLLVEAMGGSVSVHDAPGGGARFAVSLPTT